MSIGLTVVGGCAALILDYFAFVTVRLARNHDTDGDFVSYADRPWGKTDPAVPLPYVVLFIVLGIVCIGLVIRTWGPPRRLAAERLTHAGPVLLAAAVRAAGTAAMDACSAMRFSGGAGKDQRVSADGARQRA